MCEFKGGARASEGRKGRKEKNRIKIISLIFITNDNYYYFY